MIKPIKNGDRFMSLWWIDGQMIEADSDYCDDIIAVSETKIDNGGIWFAIMKKGYVIARSVMPKLDDQQTEESI